MNLINEIICILFGNVFLTILLYAKYLTGTRNSTVNKIYEQSHCSHRVYIPMQEEL